MGSTSVRVYPLAFFYVRHWWEVDLRVWPQAGTRWSERQLHTEPVVRRVFAVERSDDGELYADDLDQTAIKSLLELNSSRFVDAYTAALRKVPGSPIAGKEAVEIGDVSARPKPEGRVLERTMFSERYAVVPDYKVTDPDPCDGAILVRRGVNS